MKRRSLNDEIKNIRIGGKPEQSTVGGAGVGKMRKGFVIVSMILCMFCFVFVSCQADATPPIEEEKPDTDAGVPAEKGLIEATLVIEDDKNVVVHVPDQIEKYQYKATPLFGIEEDEADGNIFGEQKYWREFKTDAKGRLANMGWYRQGYWRFEIRTLNKRGQVLMTGSTEETGDVYLQKGKDNIIKITLHTDDGDGREGQNENTGKIKFAFETNQLSTNLKKQYVRIEVDKLTTEGVVDTKSGRFHTMFVLKDGTQEAQDFGNGWEKYYDVHGLGSTSPTGKQEMPVFGYSDAWKTVKENETDKGLLATADGFSAKVPDGRIRFYAETPDLIEGTGTELDENGVEVEVPTYSGGITPGAYIVRAKVCVVDDTTGDEIVIGGQAMAVKVVGGETTTVIGSLLQEKYIPGGLSITIPEDVSGNITTEGEGSNLDKFVVRSDNLVADKPTITLTYTPDEAIDASKLSYLWYVNGNEVHSETASSYRFVPTKYGDQKITCVVFGKAGDTDNLGEIGSATMVVRVMQKTGPNI